MTEAAAGRRWAAAGRRWAAAGRRWTLSGWDSNDHAQASPIGPCCDEDDDDG